VRTLLIRWLILAVAIAIAVALVSGINVHGGVGGYILVAAVLGLVNALIRPIVRLFSKPITFMTLGLFSLVINGLMLLRSSAPSSSRSSRPSSTGCWSTVASNGGDGPDLQGSRHDRCLECYAQSLA
jgi:uncharacterized membrane protein YvlD (DUF360 family)